MASSSSTSAAAIIGAPPATKLTRANFMYWHAQVLPTLRGARVMGLLDGSDSSPPEVLEAEDENKKKVSIPNPAYDTWITRDQQVVSFLVNSLSEEVLPHVFGCTHASDVWRALQELYTSQSKSRVSTLRDSLTSTKKQDMTAQQFITKMKGYASELSAAGKPVDDDELKDYILNGLDGNFNALAAAINDVPSTSLSDMCSQLLPCCNKKKLMKDIKCQVCLEDEDEVSSQDAPKKKLSHGGLWGSNPQDFVKQAQSRKAFHLVEVKIVVIELKWNAQV
ncbi:hypothetical protein QYE76_034982 [Lolium multiflorum]|uniref:Retrotransposon Copia-like N-terminal domain-containing protein n=1 Tax=Lolium multiflorum TaxID=4521 RepID=A0AAD8R1N0_LOLMU|nr:hypothetical protein QYE76_034982 [Lolium multiflorum]